MIRLIPLFALLCALTITSAQPAPPSPKIEASAGFNLENILDYHDIHAFTWDEHGIPWVLSGAGQRLVVGTIPGSKSGVIQSVRSIERRGNERAGLLVHANTVFVSDGDSIRISSTDLGKPDSSLYFPPTNLFPTQTQITRLYWSPLGPIYFLYHSPSAQESGVGRVNLQANQWDIVAKGISGNLAFDLNGFAVASDVPSASLFRLALGLDYQRGLETYKKSDLALSLDKPEIKPSFATIYSGSAWPGTNHGTWLIFDAATSSLQQFREENGTLKHWRILAHLDHESKLSDAQIGPDGAAWLLLERSQQSSILRLDSLDASNATTKDLSKLNSEELVAQFTNSNSWHHDAALRILDTRAALRTARGLHPHTPLHRAYGEMSNSPIARVYVTLSLHRLGLLDETFLENVADERNPLLRTWSGLLFGERNYPTGVAFDMLIKLAKDTNIVVRSAAAIAARQFVSSSLAVDTPPRAMPIREVYTGGILSTLWFSTEKGSTPEFDLLYWNAVRPISAYDSAHPIGFFNGDKDSGLAIAYWIIGLITRQIAETEDPLKQEDAMVMLGQLNPQNPRMVLAALHGLKTGIRKANPTAPTLEVLTNLTKSDNTSIAALSQQILAQWQQSFKTD